MSVTSGVLDTPRSYAEGTETAYTGTRTWTATVAPSGATNHRQWYTRIGNLVTYQITINDATAGTVVTNLLVTFPTQFPTPVIPSGFTGASAKLYTAAGRMLTSPTGTPTAANGYFLQRNAADTGFEFASAAFTAGSNRIGIITGSYFTA